MKETHAKTYAIALAILISGMQLARAIDSEKGFQLIIAIVLVFTSFFFLWIVQE